MALTARLKSKRARDQGIERVAANAVTPQEIQAQVKAMARRGMEPDAIAAELARGFAVHLTVDQVETYTHREITTDTFGIDMLRKCVLRLYKLSFRPGELKDKAKSAESAGALAVVYHELSTELVATQRKVRATAVEPGDEPHPQNDAMQGGRSRG